VKREDFEYSEDELRDEEEEVEDEEVEEEETKEEEEQKSSDDDSSSASKKSSAKSSVMTVDSIDRELAQDILDLGELPDLGNDFDYAKWTTPALWQEAGYEMMLRLVLQR
jgi:hypothetical protein